MEKFIGMTEPLTNFEKFTLILVSFWLIYLGFNCIIKRYRSVKNRRMLLDYLRFKNEKWNVLLAILRNNNDIDSRYVSEQIEVDLSNLDTRYKVLIYNDLKKIKKFNHFNKTNYQLISRLLSNKRFVN